MEPAHFWSQGQLVNGVRILQLIIKHDLTHRLQGRTLGVRSSVRVLHLWGHRCGTGPLLEKGFACDWRQKLTIDYKTWFDTSVPLPDTWYQPQFPGSTSLRAPMWNRPTSYKTWFLTHRFLGQTLVSATVSGFNMGEGTHLEQAQDPLVKKWCQKLAIDYKTWFDTTFPRPDTWCPPQGPSSTSVRPPMWNIPTSGARVHLWMVSEVGNWL